MDLITFQISVLDQEESECEEQDVEDTLTAAEKVPKKMHFH